MKILLTGKFGRNNVGDEAILGGLLANLANDAPEFDITVLSEKPAQTREMHKVRTLPTQPKGIKDKAKFLLSSENKELKNALEEAELLIWAGGGFLSDWMKGSLDYWLDKINWALKSDVKVFLCGVGAGPINTEEGKQAIHETLEEIDLITVRDEYSRRCLVGTGIEPETINVTGDPSWNLPPASEARIKELARLEKINEADGLKVSLSLPPWFHLNDLWDKRGKYYLRYKDALVETCNFLISEYKANLFFVAMNQKLENDEMDDQEFMTELQGALKSRKSSSIIKNTYSHSDMKSVFGMMDIHIGVRYHSLIMAASEYVPIIGIVNHPKVGSLLKITRQEDAEPVRVGDGTSTVKIEEDLDSELLISAIKDKVTHLDFYKGYLEETVPEIVTQASQNASIAARAILE